MNCLSSAEEGKVPAAASGGGCGAGAGRASLGSGGSVVETEPAAVLGRGVVCGAMLSEPTAVLDGSEGGAASLSGFPAGQSVPEAGVRLNAGVG